ncbi:alpha/beta fold hydrolase [Oceanirhabdus sp. W0125-5]|uniref:alpha/beta fold hydrolase n=1 Tax=Oceanirhabdus sp. W0125-5 TaxID=2999116 RepID=UPI0022F30C64|nr:alpha/beta hydrolase [Oceanirhabdus sp. W0125-5]WBW95569.1 alpha/beta hydrolase [Oceanirhabdus sp. W0125-5]
MKTKIIKIIILTILLSFLLIFFLPSRTPKYNRNYNNSISELNMVEIGGVEQSILIRGTNKDNPIVLFLHGGPGYPQISFARKYQKKLEEEFIVVNWDQRGAGKSYSRDIPEHSMTREQFVLDTNEVIDYLCKKLNKKSVYLVGHSWGSELGLYVVDKYPEKIKAYIGIGQVVDGTIGEIISYEYVYNQAKENNDVKSIEILDRIGIPPYSEAVKETAAQRKILSKYHGVEKQVNTLNDIIIGSIFSPEYTGIDFIRFVMGNAFSAKAMWGQNSELNFIKELPKVKVPVYFCGGRYDYNTPSILVEEYYNLLQAPYKEFIWFEDSAHFPQFEEVEKFTLLMVRIKNTHEKIKGD